MVPELKVWRNVAVMLIAFSIFTAYRLSGNDSLAQRVFSYYKACIADMHPSGKDTVQVLFIGTSLTKYALGPSEDALKHRLETVLGQSVRLGRMVINSANADLLLQHDVPAHVVRYFPDYIFLEANMFMVAADEKDNAAWERDFAVFYITKYPMAFFYATDNTIEKIVGNLRNEFLKEYQTGEKAPDRFRALKDRRYVSLRAEVIDAWRDAIESLSEKATVVMIRYPLPDMLPEYDRQLTGVMENLGKKLPGQVGSGQVWTMPDSLISEPMFVDGVHLSRIGSGRFLDWVTLKMSVLHDQVN